MLGPGCAPARETAEGYVEATAYLARDGLLEYGDGSRTWLEYRPHTELARSLEAWRDKPLTMLHPDDMVDSETWGDVAVGHIVDTWLDYGTDGVTYLAARIVIMDAEAVRVLRRGENREVSIGFWCTSIPTEDGRAVDGTQCAAVQTDIVPNHAAHVPLGRAGAACRVFLDAANAVVHDCGVAKRKDTGAPTETVEYPLPDGTIAAVPTAVVALIETLQQQVATLTMAAAQPKPEDEPAPAPAPAPEPEDDKPAPEPAPAPEDEPAPAPAQNPDEEPEEDEEDPDMKKKDSVSIPIGTVRKAVADRFPDLADVVDNMTADQLSPLFDKAMSSKPEPKGDGKQPDPKPEPKGDDKQTDGNPFAKPAPVGRNDAAEQARLAGPAKYLADHGY